MSSVLTRDQLRADLGGPQPAQIAMEDLIETMFYGPLQIIEVTGDTTISSAHANRMVQVNKATNVTLTLPANLPAGFSFMVDQVGAGLVIFAVAANATKFNKSSFDRTSGQHALMNAYVRSNSDGLHAVWALGGDGATA